MESEHATAEMRAARFPVTPKLLGSSIKIAKGEKRGILTAILYLSPATESGRNLCPWATAGCAAACLGHSSGQMTFSTSKNSRIWKTALFLYARPVFDMLLHNEIDAHVRKAHALGFKPAVRLNGTSDCLPAWSFAEAWPGVQFYDYTKSVLRARRFAAAFYPANYHVTFSRSGENDAECIEILGLGGNVAVVFSGELPHRWQGYPVLDADDTDLRFDDAPGHVAGLSFKGNRADVAGSFVVQG